MINIDTDGVRSRIMGVGHQLEWGVNKRAEVRRAVYPRERHSGLQRSPTALLNITAHSLFSIF